MAKKKKLNTDLDKTSKDFDDDSLDEIDDDDIEVVDEDETTGNDETTYHMGEIIVQDGDSDEGEDEDAQILRSGTKSVNDDEDDSDGQELDEVWADDIFDDDDPYLDADFDREDDDGVYD